MLENVQTTGIFIFSLFSYFSFIQTIDIFYFISIAASLTTKAGRVKDAPTNLKADVTSYTCGVKLMGWKKLLLDILEYLCF